MPFYEYQCEKCGHDVEVMQKVSDAPLKKCPKCGKSSMKRLMSAPVFRLKGSGWYETDFKSDQDNKRNLADKPEPDAKDDKPAAKKDDAKADAKVEAPAKAAETPAKPAPAADKSASKSAAKPRRAGAASKKAPPKSKAKAKRRR